MVAKVHVLAAERASSWLLDQQLRESNWTRRVLKDKISLEEKDEIREINKARSLT